MTNATFWNYCKWNSTTAGTAAFTVGTAAATDDISAHDVPENCDVVNGQKYRYFAQSADGSQLEWGRGTYNSATHKLSRDLILTNSDGTTSPVNFSTNPIVDIFPSPQKSVSSPTFPTGTLMLFQQTSAPVGWTKQTTHNDKALRVVSGTAGSGGSNNFSTVMAQTTTGGHGLSAAEGPAHAHGPGGSGDGFFEHQSGGLGTQDGLAPAGTSGSSSSEGTISSTTASSGSGTPHTHPITMDIKYVDIIIASKN